MAKISWVIDCFLLLLTSLVRLLCRPPPLRWAVRIVENCIYMCLVGVGGRRGKAAATDLLSSFFFCALVAFFLRSVDDGGTRP
jgi:hypothetical protein